MKFKNLIVYTFSEGCSLYKLTNGDKLVEHAFTPCSPIDTHKMGFVSPYGSKSNNMYVGDVPNLIMVQTETRTVPSGALNKALQERVKEAEYRLQRTLKKSEKSAYKDEVMIDLLPRAFSSITQTPIWINYEHKILAIGTSSFKRAEGCIALLRKALGTLSISPVNFDIGKDVLEYRLTDWLLEKAPKPFTVGENAVLVDRLEVKTKVSFSNVELISNPEVQEVLNGGRTVRSLEVIHDNGVKFTISHMGVFSKIKLPDVAFEAVQYDPVEEYDLVVDANFYIASKLLADAICDLQK